VTRLRRLWLLLLVLAAAPLSGQELRLEGADTTPALRLAREILADARYLRIDRDTTLPESFVAPGDLVIVDAEVRLEGTVEGRVAVLGGNLFIRPGARIRGAVAVVGGAVYHSGLASTGEIVRDSIPRDVEVALDPAGERVATVRALPGFRPPPFDLPGIRLPTYDRVSGLTVGVAPRWRLARRWEGALADGWLLYHTARRSFDAGAELFLPLRDSLYLRARAGRETLTDEQWIRGDLSNTAGALLFGTDERDYYAADRVSLTLGRIANVAPAPGSTDFAPRLTLLASRDRSLRARDPWSLIGSLDRENLAVDEGTLVSAAAGLGVRWTGRTSTFLGDATLERGLGGVGDFTFTQGVVDGLWTSQALRGHQVSVRFRGMAALGDDPAPRQRWSFVGGPSTLATFDIAEMRGDRLAYVESSYGIPYRRVMIRFLGFPTLRFTHVTGAAWPTGEPMPAWLQNVRAGVYFPFAYADVFVDPTAERLSPRFALGLTFPGF
jgi:hypothetical protein